MIYVVYILKCSNSSYYVGHTENLARRIQEHKSRNGAYHTRIFNPFELVYSEILNSKKDALARELQIKKWSRSKKEALISGDFETLKKLSKKNFPKDK